MEQSKQNVLAQLQALRAELAAAIAEMIVRQPKMSYPNIAKEFGVSRATVIAAAHKHNVTRRAGAAAETQEANDGQA